MTKTTKTTEFNSNAAAAAALFAPEILFCLFSFFPAASSFRGRQTKRDGTQDDSFADFTVLKLLAIIPKLADREVRCDFTTYVSIATYQQRWLTGRRSRKPRPQQQQKREQKHHSFPRWNLRTSSLVMADLIPGSLSHPFPSLNRSPT